MYEHDMYDTDLPVHRDDATCAALRDEGYGVTARSLGEWIGFRELDGNSCWPACGCRNRCSTCVDWRLVTSSNGDMALQKVDPKTRIPAPPDAERLKREANAFRCLHTYAESFIRREDDRGLAIHLMRESLDGARGF